MGLFDTIGAIFSNILCSFGVCEVPYSYGFEERFLSFFDFNGVE